ncbi:SHOCT domain-containing protein [Thiohalophilus sp.]|uniref:SHOCT domain-containing protein n=1 Tax=Thiohalophilus sp. TaxID=3028392 RepID=UPI002ACEA12F|nr:SHOCT domain-containing protein [Thiohalophilus sp.]MDZ7660935.1 SHOCT domain-containing protein [Thiohalophilus sp.]
MRKLIVTLSIVLLTACSTASTIKKASESESAFADAVYEGEKSVVEAGISDENAYRIFHQAATGFVSIQSIRVSAEKRASDFCKKQNKEMRTLSERTSRPPHILGNFPRIEIVFICESNAEIKTNIGNPGKYEQIKKLKDLYDAGALTREEFESEKSKLLSK